MKAEYQAIIALTLTCHAHIITIMTSNGSLLNILIIPLIFYFSFFYLLDFVQWLFKFDTNDNTIECCSYCGQNFNKLEDYNLDVKMERKLQIDNTHVEEEPKSDNNQKDTEKVVVSNKEQPKSDLKNHLSELMDYHKKKDKIKNDNLIEPHLNKNE